MSIVMIEIVTEAKDTVKNCLTSSSHDLFLNYLININWFVFLWLAMIWQEAGVTRKQHVQVRDECGWEDMKS